MFGMSLGEMLMLGALALIVVGPKQMPELARYLGRFLNDLKRSTEDITSDLKKQASIDFDWEQRLKNKNDTTQTNEVTPAIDSAPSTMPKLDQEGLQIRKSIVGTPEQDPVQKRLDSQGIQLELSDQISPAHLDISGISSLNNSEEKSKPS